MKISTVLEQDFVSRLSSKQTGSIKGEEELANAIVVQAVKDYRDALRGETIKRKPPEYTIKECEDFFRSQWYSLLTKVDGEMLIKRLQEEYHNESNTCSTDK